MTSKTPLPACAHTGGDLNAATLRGRKVLALVEDDAAASGVICIAGALASLYSATPEAVHAGEPRAKLISTARAACVPLRTVPGPALDVLTSIAGGPEVAAVVIGAGPGRTDQLIGSTALALLTN